MAADPPFFGVPVGTAAALILLITKYVFSDILVAGTVEVDPSRVANRSERHRAGQVSW